MCGPRRWRKTWTRSLPTRSRLARCRWCVPSCPTRNPWIALVFSRTPSAEEKRDCLAYWRDAIPLVKTAPAPSKPPLEVRRCRCPHPRPGRCLPRPAQLQRVRLCLLKLQLTSLRSVAVTSSRPRPPAATARVRVSQSSLSGAGVYPFNWRKTRHAPRAARLLPSMNG